jgi:hypothetical protein
MGVRINFFRIHWVRFFVYMKIFRLCFYSLKKLNLGDIVVYRNRRWVLFQGVQNPYWDLSLLGEKETANVHRDLFLKEKSLGNFMHDLRSTYRFYRGYWFDIWVRADLGDISSFRVMRHMPRMDSK